MLHATYLMEPLELKLNVIYSQAFSFLFVLFSLLHSPLCYVKWFHLNKEIECDNALTRVPRRKLLWKRKHTEKNTETCTIHYFLSFVGRWKVRIEWIFHGIESKHFADIRTFWCTNTIAVNVFLKSYIIIIYKCFEMNVRKSSFDSFFFHSLFISRVSEYVWLYVFVE